MAAAAAPALAADETPPPVSKPPETEPVPIVLPRRPLGRTGVEVTILAQGAAFAINERILNMMHALGIRYIDAAAAYMVGNAERIIGKWFHKTGLRQEYFLVDKDAPLTPEQMTVMIDKRLETLQSDYIDLFMLAPLGESEHYHGLEDARWFNDPKWTRAVEKIRKSGKVRFFGFSSHTSSIDVRTGLLNAAAKGGWVDALMVSADPTVLRSNAAFAKAVDACHKAGVGLVSMKQTRGGPAAIKKIFPSFEEKGFNAYTAVLAAMWTDERFASVCSHMDTFDKLRENATACRNFKPLTADELASVETMLRGAERTYCLACDGRCRRAAGTRAELNTVARYVNYAEEDGRVFEARHLLVNMPPAARNWPGADLYAARNACKCHLDYPNIIKRAEELLAGTPAPIPGSNQLSG
jgi:predicted aldo/keto reductase-like oxidoreductase